MNEFVPTSMSLTTGSLPQRFTPCIAATWNFGAIAVHKSMNLITNQYSATVFIIIGNNIKKFCEREIFS